jgi:hypothetical protein
MYHFGLYIQQAQLMLLISLSQFIIHEQAFMLIDNEKHMMVRLGRLYELDWIYLLKYIFEIENQMCQYIIIFPEIK